MPTPQGGGENFEREVLEPIVVLRPRRTDALADLFRELTELSDEAPGQEKTRTYEAVNVAPAEPPTQRIPPVPPHRPGPQHRTGSPHRSGPQRRSTPSHRPGPPPPQATGKGVRRAAGIIAVSAAALAGFAAAILLLPGRGGDSAAARPQPRPPVASAPVQQEPAPAPSAPAAQDPVAEDPGGVLREGASGAEVVDLQERLRRIPNVYDNGSTSGDFDAALTEAVARFQVWYGIRGDESGVYGDHTRRDLEARTS
ncbi:peptidoglycan-binding protein [Streptomyces roseirectus]|uniref:Peptidoglycan-binding protein n=1 Tax=Streptomyces roseirectus TaxID=2768066 RepID=A0A7H0IP23_9ACTN|nr:peptidoglycan-binding protein [Streptomyces roseirectus]QNP74539.1 peptidoglycan-binding protein [Streptomyces roseirectus]